MGKRRERPPGTEEAIRRVKDKDDPLTQTEAARALDVPRRTFRGWLKAEGLCHNCAEPALPGQTLCKKHADKHADKQAEWQHSFRGCAYMAAARAVSRATGTSGKRSSAYGKRTMTVHELWHWVLEHPDYPALYQAWVDSGYHRDFAPSVDRIDCDHPTDAYTLNNIELTTTHMNRAKQNIEMRRRREREYEQTAAVA